METAAKKAWSGRFTKRTDRLAESFTASVPFDQRLCREDIAGSLAHARMLARQGIITPAEAEKLVEGLVALLAAIENGEVLFDVGHEDIHMAVESKLRERIGLVAGKLHTARSRNDQVALDFRLYARRAVLEMLGGIIDLQETLLQVAEAHSMAAMPGYTHMQRAQPILFSHHLLAYFEMLNRDLQRLREALVRIEVSPLGSGALAGVPYPIDREFVAGELGFPAISPNSLDAVSDRDFVIELMSCASLAMCHLSRLAQEIVLWSTAEYGFVELDDSFATGSSIMPQKKNPDAMELVRGKSGRVFGHLAGMLATVKGLPLAYNSDLQEDKEALFDTVDTLSACLAITAPLVATMKVNHERMRQAAADSFSLATDVADYLSRKSMPFREAHEVVGRIVRHCLEAGKALDNLTLEEYQAFSPLFDAGVLDITVESSVAARDIPGGTAPNRVVEAMRQANAGLAENRAWLEKKYGSLPLELRKP